MIVNLITVKLTGSDLLERNSIDYGRGIQKVTLTLTSLLSNDSEKISVLKHVSVML